MSENSDKIIVTCTRCGVKIRIPANHGLLEVKCPKCNNTFRVNSGEKKMSFADELKSSAEAKHHVNIPSKNEKLEKIMNDCVRDIKSLCKQEANKGKYNLTGYVRFHKYVASYDCDIYEAVIDIPSAAFTQKPHISYINNSLEGKYTAILDADNSWLGEETVERISLELPKRLNNMGFKRMSFKHVTAPRYVSKQGGIFYPYHVERHGDCHLIYADIAW